MKILISAADAAPVKQLKEILKETHGKETIEVVVEKSYSKAFALLPKLKPSLFLFSFEQAKKENENFNFPSSSVDFFAFGRAVKHAKAVLNAGGQGFMIEPFDAEIIAMQISRWKKKDQGDKSIKVTLENGKEQELLISKIQYIEADNKNCHIFLKDSKKVTVVRTLKYLLEKLPVEFIRVHKTFIVRKSIIEKFFYQFGGRYMISLKGGQEIPVGRKFYKTVKMALMS